MKPLAPHPSLDARPRPFTYRALCALVALAASACSSDTSSSSTRGPDRGPDRGRDAAPSTDTATPDDEVAPRPDDDVDPGDDDASANDDNACTAEGTFCDGNRVATCDGGRTVVQRVCNGACSNGACAVNACADEKGYFGCAFLAVDLDNASIAQFGATPATPAADEVWGVVVSNPNDFPVVTTLYGASGTIVGGPIVVAPGQVHIYEPPQANADGSLLAPLAFRLEADAPVTAHQFNPLNRERTYSNDASLLYPIALLGTEYIAMAWPTEVPPILLPGTQNVLNTFVTIAAPGPGRTRIDIELPAGVSIVEGPGVPAIPAGGSATFELNPLDVLSLTTPQTNRMDPTGMRISSSQPVAVFGGAECAFVPMGTAYCDHLEDQLLPVHLWGRSYTVAKTRPRGSEPDVYRVVAATDGTRVMTSPAQPGADGVVLARGGSLEFRSAELFVLEATHPVMVGQYMVGSNAASGRGLCDRDDGGVGCAIRSDRRCQYLGNEGTVNGGFGDPSFTVLVPDERWLDDYLVLTPRDYMEDWLTLIAPADAELTVDGVVVTAPGTPIAGTNTVVRYVPTTAGAHRVGGTAPFALYAYGHECDVSYSYAGGINLGN